MSTIALAIFAFISSLLGTVRQTTLIPRYHNTPTPTVVILQTPTPTLTPVPTSTITPQAIVPSQKSLQVAAFLWIRISKDQQDQVRNKYGGANDTDIINRWATAMDKNPAAYAGNEALMEYRQQQEKRVYVPYYYSPESHLHSCLSFTNGNWTNTSCN